MALCSDVCEVFHATCNSSIDIIGEVHARVVSDNMKAELLP